MAACQSIPCCSSIFLPSSRLITNSLKPFPLFSKTQNFNFLIRPTNTSKLLPLAPPRVAVPPAQTGQQEEDGEVRTQDETGGESSSDKFSWRDHCYPVSLVEDLDHKLPTVFQLLGRDLVTWFDGSEDRWVVFDDKCPHRLAPLLGFFVVGRKNLRTWDLQCLYRGWSFSGCGSCTRIPQASSEGPEARALKSPRACAGRFPAMISRGLLFVWPDENGWERAKSAKPAKLPDDFDKPEFSTVTIQRDLFYVYDTAMENVFDPSHIDFAHQKVVPRWHEHWMSNKVYDGDMIGLQGQGKIFLSKSMEGIEDINKQTLTSLSRLAFRNWLRHYGQRQHEWFGSSSKLPPPSTYLSRKQMLDRFEQDTRKCTSCKNAYKAFQKCQKLLIGTTVICCATVGIPSAIQLLNLLAGAAILFTAAAYALHELGENFIYVDYVHTEIE